MASPHEALGIDPFTVDRMAELPAQELALYVGTWLARTDVNGDPFVGLVSNDPDRPSLAHNSGADLQAMYVETALRAVRTLLGPDAQIVMGGQNG